MQNCSANKHSDEAPDLLAEITMLRVRVQYLERLINTPETEDFLKAVPLEAAHQVERWGKAADDAKSEQDWIFLFGWLAGKATQARKDGDITKAKHHAITAAAALFNWHRRLSQ